MNLLLRRGASGVSQAIRFNPDKSVALLIAVLFRYNSPSSFRRAERLTMSVALDAGEGKKNHVLDEGQVLSGIRASQALDVGSIPIARSILTNNSSPSNPLFTIRQ